ncbi:MAG: hypothetical protein ACK4JE_00635, partial [Endomicrobiia bacterium]
MTITLKEIKEKKKVEMSFFENLTKELIKDCRFEKPVKVNCTFVAKSNKIYLSIEISGILSANCDRCLENFTKSINIVEKRDINFSDFGEVFDISEEIF